MERPRAEGDDDLDDLFEELPEDDPDLEGFVGVRELRPSLSAVRDAIEDAIRTWPVELPVPSAEPQILLFIRRDPDRYAEYRDHPACLFCTLPGSLASVHWSETGVLCFIHEAESQRREAERSVAFGPGGALGWFGERLKAFAASPQGGAFDRYIRSLRPAKRGPKKGSHDPDLVKRVLEQEDEDDRTGTRRSIEEKAAEARTTEKTYRAIKNESIREK